MNISLAIVLVPSRPRVSDAPTNALFAQEISAQILRLETESPSSPLQRCKLAPCKAYPAA